MSLAHHMLATLTITAPLLVCFGLAETCPDGDVCGSEAGNLFLLQTEMSMNNWPNPAPAPQPMQTLPIDGLRAAMFSKELLKLTRDGASDPNCGSHHHSQERWCFISDLDIRGDLEDVVSLLEHEIQGDEEGHDFKNYYYAPCEIGRDISGEQVEDQSGFIAYPDHTSPDKYFMTRRSFEEAKYQMHGLSEYAECNAALCEISHGNQALEVSDVSFKDTLQLIAQHLSDKLGFDLSRMLSPGVHQLNKEQKLHIKLARNALERAAGKIAKLETSDKNTVTTDQYYKIIPMETNGDDHKDASHQH